MSQRKIKLTLSGNILHEIGPILDIDFNGTMLDEDLEIAQEHGVGSMVREYTVDATAGAHTLSFTFKNDDMGPDDVVDRNFVIDKIELAHDGITYTTFQPTEITVLSEDGSTLNYTGTYEEFDSSQLYLQPNGELKMWKNASAPITITFVD